MTESEETSLKIIVGLGNPGQEYSQTRHNVGFMAIDALAARLGASAWRGKFDAEIAEVRFGNEMALLVKPQTYMNLSGEAVGQIVRWYKLAVEDIIAIYDDMDIPVGTARLRKRGSSGGHRGVESMLLMLGEEAFARVRIGVGRPLPGWKVVDHVLANFSPEDKVKIDELIESLLPAIECIAKDGIEKAMSRYGFKQKKEQVLPEVGEVE